MQKTLINAILFALFFISQLSYSQVPFEFYESTSPQSPGYITPITSYHHELDDDSDNSIVLMEGDMYVNFDNLSAGITDATHSDSSCIGITQSPSFRFKYMIDTVCTDGIDWSEIRFKDCTGAGCIYYDDFSFPLTFSNTTPVDYKNTNVICFLRQQFDLHISDLNVENEGYIEFMFKIGSYDLSPGSGDFDNVVYSEYPITISINEGVCPSSSEGEGEGNVGLEEINPDDIDIIYLKDEEMIFVNFTDQEEHEVNTKLINLEGKVINEMQTDQCEFNIPCSQVENGVYILRLEDKVANRFINQKIYID